jgi:Flp pilus assembly pilin Flp
MLKYYIWGSETARRLRHDAKGVVSFEYVIVAACVVAAVAAAFGTGGTGPIKTALTDAISTISTTVTGAVNPAP